MTILDSPREQVHWAAFQAFGEDKWLESFSSEHSLEAALCLAVDSKAVYGAE